jgi:uncharacterized membrane protein YuzA (DUF378 family)
MQANQRDSTTKGADMSGIDIVARLLAGIGAVNWGLVALAEFDLVAAIFGLDFGQTNAATRVVYGLVGLAGLWVLARVFVRADASRPVTARVS